MISWGACNHAYHTHCISKWTTQKKNTCPLCQKAWTTVKTAKEWYIWIIDSFISIITKVPISLEPRFPTLPSLLKNWGSSPSRPFLLRSFALFWPRYFCSQPLKWERLRWNLALCLFIIGLLHCRRGYFLFRRKLSSFNSFWVEWATL